MLFQLPVGCLFQSKTFHINVHAECQSTCSLHWFETLIWDGVAQCVARLTRNVEVVGSNPIKDPRCFLEQGILPLLLCTTDL